MEDVKNEILFSPEVNSFSTVDSLEIFNLIFFDLKLIFS